jgi:starch synthase
MGKQIFAARVSKTLLDNSIPVYLIGGAPGFSEVENPKKDIYGKPTTKDYCFFAAAAIEMLQAFARSGEWRPDIIHVHDFHTAFIPIYLKTIYKGRLKGLLVTPKTVLTIHNLGFPGLFGKELLPALGLPRELDGIDWMEFYGTMSALKGGLVLSDMVSAVSPTYATEILSEPYGELLHGVLQSVYRNGRLRGILNGIQPDDLSSEARQSDPAFETGKDLRPFLEAKARIKEEIRRNHGLAPEHNTPLLIIQGRWGWQKGWALFAELLANGYLIDFQVIAETWASSGQDIGVMQQLREYGARKTGRFALLEEQPRNILRLAASDFVLLPSLYEPCGLIQMEAMRFATIPVARRTGGLADTVFEGQNGFLFDCELVVRDMDKRTALFYAALKQLGIALRSALAVYRDPERLLQCRKSCFIQDNSWQQRMKSYKQLYEDVLALPAPEFVR